MAYMEDEGLLHPKQQQQDEPKQPSQGPEEEQAAEEKKLDIEEFAYDLTRAAREGKLDPVVGRDTEIARVIENVGQVILDRPKFSYCHFRLLFSGRRNFASTSA